MVIFYSISKAWSPSYAALKNYKLKKCRLWSDYEYTSYMTSTSKLKDNFNVIHNDEQFRRYSFDNSKDEYEWKNPKV